MATERLTAKGVEALSTTKPREDVWDELTPGLHLRVSRTGGKTWYVRYRTNGTHRRHKLGSYPALSLAEARRKARDAQVAADAGEDPAQERQERRKGHHTFEALAEEVLEARARKTRESTQRERQRILEVELLPEWKGRAANSITRRDVVQLVEAVARRGAPVLANRVLAVIRLIFNDGMRRGFPGLEANPAHLVEAPADEEPRERWLNRDELRAVWQALDDSRPLTQAAFRLTLLTAQRIGAVCAMRWEDVTGDLWTIPAAEFKGRRIHLVPLSDEALAILDALRARREDGEPYVFPSRAGAKNPHVTNLSSATLQRVRDRSGIPHWTIHDFRTSFRTHALRPQETKRKDEPAGLGLEPRIADAVLGHAESTVGAKHYQGDKARLYLAEKREALERWGRFVREAVEEES